ncbi:fungal-specific transcription factor domain-containing protein [Dipodascopsis tothii]|uniref:fungal-specific transcription factor domain-containing protein n=1 Tax=Dipodascopsis tothii TaxID=44089 RepID=UPI0034CD64F8
MPAGSPLADDDGSIQAKKRRRSRKGLEKIFECEIDGCGKKFTRSEHLARHQLNHMPKEIYVCPWPGCTKSFVREDLLIRHVDRHPKRSGAPGDLPAIANIKGPAGKRAAAAAAVAKGLALEAGMSSAPPLAAPPLEYGRAGEYGHEFPPPAPGLHPPGLPAYDGMLDSDDNYANTHMGASPSTEGSTTDLINWLFSDGMFSASSKDLFKMTSFDPTVDSSLNSPVDLPNLFTPPAAPQFKLMSDTKRLDILGLIPTLEAEPQFELDYIHMYITLYWDKFHFQYPILHRPSFEADSTPGPLLWSIIMIGAAYAKEHDLAMKIAEPLRWVIFKSPGFHPPVKIWIIQSLLLLEVYEKTMATRRFHERAHIHHGTTLQLIRRGSILFGSSASSSLIGNGQTMRAANSAGGSGASTSSSGSSGGPSNSEAIWKQWVEAESAKRATLMAFVLDVSHAVLFGHSLVMSTHEIRLTLPCDDDAWERMPPVGADGIWNWNQVVRAPTLPFFRALKQILKRERVVCGRFGRKVLLAGLMSLSCQMTQLDLQVSSLGWGAFRDKWRSTLGPALDFWKREYDRALRIYVKRTGGDPLAALDGRPNQDGTALYNYSDLYAQREYERILPPEYPVAHIDIRCDLLDLQVFCGIHVLLIRPTRQQDYLASQARVRDWANTSSASEAVFQALQALYEIFISGESGYKAEDDVLIHRPQVISICAIVVWSYCFCREGPESHALARGPDGLDSSMAAMSTGGSQYSPANLSTPSDSKRTPVPHHKYSPEAEPGLDFIRRMHTARTPKELELITGKNRMVGMIRLVMDAISASRFQLMSEWGALMEICLERSLGRDITTVRGGKGLVNE